MTSLGNVSGRRVGPALSRRIYDVFTGRDQFTLA